MFIHWKPRDFHALSATLLEKNVTAFVAVFLAIGGKIFNKIKLRGS
jgi:hypothetical protein